MADLNDKLIPCPACGSHHVERHFARVDGGMQPGCLNCNASMPLVDWITAVAALRMNWPIA